MFKEALAKRRLRRQQAQATTPGMQAFLEQPPQPRTTDVLRARFLAVDIETTGLDPQKHTILSIGCVPVDAGRIEFADARGYVLRDDSNGEGVGQSAVIHHLTDDAIAAGEEPATVLDEVFAALAGRAMLAHFAELELGFLRAFAAREWGFAPDIPAVDTLRLQAQIVAPGFDEEPRRDQLRLWAARESFGLPETRAHDALADALGCAELFLAQTGELRRRGMTTLGAYLV